MGILQRQGFGHAAHATFADGIAKDFALNKTRNFE